MPRAGAIALKRILRTALQQVVYRVRSERLLMERFYYNLLLRGYVGLNIAAPVQNHSTLSLIRPRLFDE